MRILFLLLLVSALPGSHQVQQPAKADETPLTVVSFSWRKERLPGWEKGALGSSVETYDAMRERSENERRIQQARNSGNKAELGRREGAAKMLEDAVAKDSQKLQRPRDGYRYKVVLSNTSSKSISSVDWDYFFVDPNKNEVIARHQFTSDEKIKPGKSKEVSVLYLTPPVKTISAEMLARKELALFTEHVVVMRIQYSDGSVWQHP